MKIEKAGAVKVPWLNNATIYTIDHETYEELVPLLDKHGIEHIDTPLKNDELWNIEFNIEALLLKILEDSK